MRSYVMMTCEFAALVMAFACSTSSAPNKSTLLLEDGWVAPVMGDQYTTITFDPGQADLTGKNMTLLQELFLAAHDMGKRIEKIRILSWSDKEYSEAQNHKTFTKDVLLADKRAQKIMDYLKNDLHKKGEVDFYNMAKKPSFLSQLLRDDDSLIKEAFEMSGATSTRLPDGSLSYTKASKALVIIDLEDDKDHFK